MSLGENEVKLIESTLPVDLLSRDAAIEMSFKSRSAYYARCKELGIKPPSSFYDPKIRNIHPWLARRSCSISRALNLAALLPKESANEFLNLIGFTEEELKRLVSQGYPPLIFYTRPQTREADFREEKVLDPMAGGGAIPLESLTLGIETIACEYNPVAFLLLKATVEFPAKYGFKLYQRVREEAFLLISYLQEKLKSFYEKDVEGYIFLRKVLVDGEEVPLTSLIPLTPKEYVSIGSKGVTIQKGRASLVCDKSLLSHWMRQQVQVMKEKNTELLDVVHKCLLVKTKRGFRLANEADQQLLRKAYDEYWKFKSFLPDVLLPEDNEVFKDILPLERYLNLFNPRQALALGLATEYVRKKTKEMVDKEGEFGAAVGLYLALGLDKLVDFNSILTTWNGEQSTIRDSIGSYYKFRKFRLEGIYAEAIVPFRTLEWIFEPNALNKTAGGMCPILKELCMKLEGKGDKIKVYMANVLELSKCLNERVSLINVDPPYYDQHKYSDFSEFFWPFLRTSLEEALELLFKENYVSSWSPSSFRVPKEDEVISRRVGSNSFETKLKKALIEMKKILRSDGILILWFSHRKLRAWKAVISALLEAGFRLTNVIPLVSEHPTRSVTKGGTSGISHVLALIARSSESALFFDKEEFKKRILDQAKKARPYPSSEVSDEELNVILSAVDLALSAMR